MRAFVGVLGNVPNQLLHLQASVCVCRKTRSTAKYPATILPTTGIRVSSRCNHTLTSDEEGRAALLFGGWGLGGLQQHESNKRVGAVTLAAVSTPPQEAISTNLPLLRGRGEPEHK